MPRLLRTDVQPATRAKANDAGREPRAGEKDDAAATRRMVAVMVTAAMAPRSGPPAPTSEHRFGLDLHLDGRGERMSIPAASSHLERQLAYQEPTDGQDQPEAHEPVEQYGIDRRYVRPPNATRAIVMLPSTAPSPPGVIGSAAAS